MLSYVDWWRKLHDAAIKQELVANDDNDVGGHEYWTFSPGH